MRKRWIVLSIVLTILAGGLIAADRITAAIIESKLDDRLSCRTTSGADVTVHGLPVLTQLIDGHLDEVTAHLDGLPVAGVATRVELTLKDLPTDGHGAAGQAELAATVPWDVVARPFARQYKNVHLAAESGRLALSTGSGKPTVLAAVSLDGDQLKIEPVAVRFLGQELPVQAMAGVGGRTSALLAPRSIPLPELPADLRLDSVAVTEDGLALHATGTNLAPSGLAGKAHDGSTACAAERN
jgi:hypothetical protein